MQVTQYLPASRTLLQHNPGIYQRWSREGAFDTDYKAAALVELQDIPQLRGVYVRLDWSVLETSAGVYDWTELDTLLDWVDAAQTACARPLRLMFGVSCAMFGGQASAIPLDYITSDLSWYVYSGTGSGVWQQGAATPAGIYAGSVYGLIGSDNPDPEDFNLKPTWQVPAFNLALQRFFAALGTYIAAHEHRALVEMIVLATETAGAPDTDDISGTPIAPTLLPHKLAWVGSWDGDNQANPANTYWWTDVRVYTAALSAPYNQRYATYARHLIMRSLIGSLPDCHVAIVDNDAYFGDPFEVHDSSRAHGIGSASPQLRTPGTLNQNLYYGSKPIEWPSVIGSEGSTWDDYSEADIRLKLAKAREWNVTHCGLMRLPATALYTNLRTVLAADYPNDPTCGMRSALPSGYAGVTP